MPPSPSLLEYFLDRGLGRYVVPDALRAAGMTVHTMADIYGPREQEVPDVEWLAVAGQRGWIVLAKDRRIRWRPPIDEMTGILRWYGESLDLDHAITALLSLRDPGFAGCSPLDSALYQ